MTGFRPTSGPDLANGRYLGRIVDIEERHSDRYDSDYLIWHGEVVVARDQDPVPVSGTSSVAWSSGSKAYAWAEAILGQTPDTRQPPSFDALYGKRVVVRVGRNNNDWAAIDDLEPFTGDRTGLIGLEGPAASPGPIDGATAAPQPAPVREPDPPRLPDNLPF
jgi:hypothetical protein